MNVATLKLPANSRTQRRPLAPGRTAGGLAPWVAFPLILPFGLAGGYCTTALVFQLSKGGVTTAEIGGFLFLSLIPQTVKFTYAPLVDTSLGLRRWYAIGACAAAASLAAVAFTPPTRAMLEPLTWFCFISTFAGTLVTLPADAIMAHDVAPERKGAAAGWASAANLGGGCIGGGLALWMAERGAPVWSPALALALALLCLLCIPFSWLAAPRPSLAPGAGLVNEQKALARDVWAMLRSRAGLLTLLLAVLPIGSGAMINLVPALAKEWRAGAGEVALVSGGVSGVVQIAGALVGGWVCDRWNRRWTYCAAGAGLALTAVAMALGPRTPTAFVAFNLVYAAFLGVSYSGFTSSVLEAIGKGAAASKYTLLVCASNAAIFAEQALEGWVHDRFSLEFMLYMEAVGAFIAIPIFFLAATLSKHSRPGQP